MKRPMVYTAFCFALSSATVCAEAPAPKPVMLAPGKVLEKCMVLDSGQKLQYQFDAAKKINFNLHYNKGGEQTYYPVKLDRTLGESGVYESRVRERYCLFWENRTDAEVELNFSYKVVK